MRSAARLCLLAALACLLAGPAAVGHEDHDHSGARFTEADQHRPTPLPDRVVLTWSGDPATTIDVTWRTDGSTGEPLLQCCKAAGLRGEIRSLSKVIGEKVTGTKEAFETNLGACQMNTCHAEGLEPDTLYAYRVGDGRHWSEWHQFRTASAGPKPFTFVYFGDAQNNVRSLWSRVVREANQHAPRAAFMLHAGDLVNRANSDGEWGEWFYAGGWINGMIPVVATPGNHEYSGGLSKHWRPQFTFPLNGPSGLEETAYWFDYQGARVISLNSNERIAEQTKWLEQVLADESRPGWTIVTFHHPVFSAAKERDNPLVRAAWRPVLEAGRVDLVLTGHDHAYARSGFGGPTNVPEGVRTQSSSTVYVVSVSGPKQYPVGEAWDVARVAGGVQLFQVIKVAPEGIDYEARLATGELYDAFRLTKDARGRSVLSEVEVQAAEIRRR